MSSVPKIAAAIKPLITDNELSTTYLALKVAYNLVKLNKTPKDHEVVLTAVVESVSKDQISGLALDALSDYIGICAQNKINGYR